MLPIALKAVQLQLQAMGASRYELGVRVPPEQIRGWQIADEPAQRPRRQGLTNGEVFEKLDWFAAENAKGHHIYIRPSGLSQLTLIDDLTRKSLETLLDTGYTPACVVETSPGNFQAWLKHAWTLTAQEGTVAAKILAERFGGDPNSADWRHFGRLAGFTNPKPQYRLPNGLFPYSQLKFALSKGVIYEKTHEVLSEVEDRLLDQYVEVSEVDPDAHRLSRNIPGRHLNFSTTPTSPTNMPRTANGTRQTLPMPPTHSSEASPKSKSAIPFGPIPQHPPSSTAPNETKTPILTAP